MSTLQELAAIREKLAKDTEEFLANGGKIHKIAPDEYHGRLDMIQVHGTGKKEVIERRKVSAYQKRHNKGGLKRG
jgi:hypothetical protein